VRVHPVDHPAFANDMATIAGEAGHRLTHIMVPKVESVDDVLRAEAALQGIGGPSALQVLIESPGRGAPCFRDRRPSPRAKPELWLDGFCVGPRRCHSRTAMSSAGQFTHPLVVRAKLEIASACHAHGKVPVALRGDRIQRYPWPCRPQPAAPPGVGLHPHVEHPPC
jgi:citrate lyase subunit beta/citryl-CoA lyase